MRRTLMVFCLVAGAAVSAHAADTARDAVRTVNSPKVSSTYGTCVRTKWDAGADVCAPKPAPVAIVKPMPQPVISREQRTVYFDYKKSSLDPRAMARLDKLADLIQGSKGIKQAKIVGYTDEIGGTDYNIALSERRASAVNQYIAQRIQVPTEVLTVKGLGKSDPQSNCPNIKNRQKLIDCLAEDRRVEIELVYEK